MKKSTLFLIFIASMVYACAPQVTVTPTPLPTETPIPTPTLHPQFAALQEKIAASGGRFTLSPQGTIEDNGVPIPGLTVAPDGTMTFIVNGEIVTLDPANVSFDDEKGVSIKGYQWDKTANDGAGAWEMALPEGLQQNADGTYSLTLGDGTIVKLDASQVGFENGQVTVLDDGYFVGKEGKWLMTPQQLWQKQVEKWGIDPATVTESQDENGNYIVVDNKSVETVFNQDGLIRLLYIRNLIRASGDCKVTPWTSKTIGYSGPPKERNAFTNQYLSPLYDFYRSLVKLRTLPSYGLTWIAINYLGDNCWAIVPYGMLDQTSSAIFWKDKNGVPRYQEIFMDSPHE